MDSKSILIILISALFLSGIVFSGFGEFGSGNTCRCINITLMLNSSSTTQQWVLNNDYNSSFNFFIVPSFIGTGNVPQVRFYFTNGTELIRNQNYLIPANSTMPINVVAYLPLNGTVVLASSSTKTISITKESIGNSDTSIINASPIIVNTSRGLQRYEIFTAKISNGTPPYTYNFKLYDVDNNTLLATQSGSNNTLKWLIPQNITGNVIGKVNITCVSNTPINYTWYTNVAAYGSSNFSYAGGEKINIGTSKKIEINSLPSTTSTTSTIKQIYGNLSSGFNGIFTPVNMAIVGTVGIIIVAGYITYKKKKEKSYDKESNN